MAKTFRCFRDESARQKSCPETCPGGFATGNGFAIARTSQSYSEQLPLRQQSKYFDFRFKQHPEKIKAIARFADAFIDIVNRDFFEAEFDYPIRVLVTEDFATHRTLVSEQFGVTGPTMGIFLYKYNLFATYEDSGLGTFAHEIMHPLVERNLKDRLEWAIEGIPTFFEKFYGYWRGDELVVNWGFQNPWRIKQLGTDLARLDLPGILATTRAGERESEGWFPYFCGSKANSNSFSILSKGARKTATILTSRPRWRCRLDACLRSGKTTWHGSSLAAPKSCASH